MPTCATGSTQGKTRFFDMHLSLLPQVTRYGFLGQVHWAVVEACDVTAGGGIVLTIGVGAAPTFCNQADKVLIELNRRHPAATARACTISTSPPIRRIAADPDLHAVSDRIGSPIITVARRRSSASWKPTWTMKRAASARSAR